MLSFRYNIILKEGPSKTAREREVCCTYMVGIPIGSLKCALIFHDDIIRSVTHARCCCCCCPTSPRLAMAWASRHQRIHMTAFPFFGLRLVLRIYKKKIDSSPWQHLITPSTHHHHAHVQNVSLPLIPSFHVKSLFHFCTGIAFG